MRCNTLYPYDWMSRREVALIIFPGPRADTAVPRLRRWINSDPVLLNTLREYGYRPGIHYFSPTMRLVLRKYFGGV
ncbi:MAG: DUF4248 domain-containing protein [Bacteroidales bacterium]|nr:DUF4248 domain-containing protein [Bacteroidales bacterium]